LIPLTRWKRFFGDEYFGVGLGDENGGRMLIRMAS